MPDKTFLEEYAPYRRFGRALFLPTTADRLPKVAINMWCDKCKSNQTFGMTNDYGELLESGSASLSGQILRAFYQCQHCKSATRSFYILVDPQGHWLMKVGQYPAWEIQGDAEFKRHLGEHAEYYKKGLACESQSCGLGAFGYYRRIVEQKIDEFLHEIAEFMGGDELEKFQGALERTKQMTVAEEKIDLVKDLLPRTLQPDGTNPLSVLHGALIDGSHAGTDEECLIQAAIIREVLVFLVKQVAARKAAGRSFTEGMRGLRNEKTRKGSAGTQ
jgi:hypothetical protein